MYPYFPYIYILSLVTCGALSIPNGIVTYSNGPVNGAYPVNVVASFRCNSGYSRHGLSSRTCLNTGQWNQHTPSCNQSNEMQILL